MRFEFDRKKSRLNWQRHGVDFVEAQALWEQSHVVIAAKTISGETRYALIAMMYGSCYAAIFTLRNTAVRLISCHRADIRLERIYEYQDKKNTDS